MECDPAVSAIRDDRQIEMYATTPRRRDQPAGRSLAVDGEVDRDRPTRAESGQARNRARNRGGTQLMIVGSEPATCSSQRGAQGRFAIG
jgi:hypothetical protein